MLHFFRNTLFALAITLLTFPAQAAINVLTCEPEWADRKSVV